LAGGPAVRIRRVAIETMKGQAWIELVGDIIIAGSRGEPTEDLLRGMEDQVLFLVRDAGRGRVLYDTSEMDSPSVEITLSQRAFCMHAGSIKLRRAIVVLNSRHVIRC
jgi:hypothetical protein